MRPLSKAYYLGSIAGGFVGGTLLSLVGVFLILADPPVGVSVTLCGVGVIVYGALLSFVLIFRLWEAIQGGSPRTTPGKAVGFLFIPFFNIYWVFQIWYGWAQDFNRHIAERGLDTPRVSEGLALAIPILNILSAVPYLGFLAIPVVLLLQLVFFASAIDAVNAMLTARDTAPEAAPSGPPRQPLGGAVRQAATLAPFCMRCGRSLPTTAVYCGHCGSPAGGG